MDMPFMGTHPWLSDDMSKSTDQTYTHPYIFELRKLSPIHLTIISERIIELEHNRSVQSTKTWYLSIGTHFEILTHNIR